MGTSNKTYNRLGIDIGSTTVKVATRQLKISFIFRLSARILVNIQENTLPNF